MLKISICIKVIILDFFPSSVFLEPTAIWEVCPSVWSVEHEACTFGPSVEELLNLIQKYMTVYMTECVNTFSPAPI